MEVGEPTSIIAFDDFELDLARFELRRSGVPVTTQRQVFDLLVYLVRARGRVVTKEELLDNVWGTRFVTESALTTQIKSARRALGDNGTRQRFIRTVHRRGYEFVGGDPVDTEATGPAALPATVDVGGAGSDRPSPHLVGRDGAIGDVTDMLSARRLVTITGPGGVGKTQLAFAVAGAVARRFDDGVIHVDLAAVSDQPDIARAAAESAGLGLREGTAVADALAGMRALVVFDNCEHLIDGAAEFVARILAGSDDPVRVLTTSREPLAVVDEDVFALGPLATHGHAGQASPAARLFLDRAGRSAADNDLESVERLVALLDGLPLAIELAAAQLGFMSLHELHRRLEQHRFALATETRRSTRYDSLAASVDWSWQLLDELDRTMLIELGVFPGEFGLDGAERIASCPDPLGVLRRLHAKSLVAGTRHGGSTRFRLLFGVRDFARTHQADLPRGSRGLRQRLAMSFAEWFDEWTFEEQWGSTEFLDIVLDERPTIHEISTIDDPEVATAIARVVAASATTYRYGIGIGQGRAATRALSLSNLPDDVAARLALAGSEASYAAADIDTKDRLAEHALERARAADRADLVAAALAQQCVGRMLNEPERCVQLLEDAIDQARTARSERIESYATGLLGFCHLAGAGTLDSAVSLVDHAESIAAPTGWDRVSVASVRGITRFLQDDRLGAAGEFGRVAESMRCVNVGGPAALFALLDVTCRADSASANEIGVVVDDFLREYRRATGHGGRADALLAFAHRASRLGDIERARQLVEALRGRRLAHQVSYFILNDVARRARVPTAEPGLATAAMSPSAASLDDFIANELAALT